MQHDTAAYASDYHMRSFPLSVLIPTPMYSQSAVGLGLGVTVGVGRAEFLCRGDFRLSADLLTLINNVNLAQSWGNIENMGNFVQLHLLDKCILILILENIRYVEKYSLLYIYFLMHSQYHKSPPWRVLLNVVFLKWHSICFLNVWKINRIYPKNKIIITNKMQITCCFQGTARRELW